MWRQREKHCAAARLCLRIAGRHSAATEEGMMRIVCIALCVAATAVAADKSSGQPANCKGLPTEVELKAAMNAPSTEEAGGLFHGTRMWAAVLNRDGELCA